MMMWFKYGRSVGFKCVKISRMCGSIKEAVEFALAWLLLKIFGIMPRGSARHAADVLAWLGYHLARRQRLAGFRNLQLALPELSPAGHERIVRGCFRNLGR